MKVESERKGPFRFLLRTLTNNWWLKLLALALAVIIYHSLKSEKDNSHPSHDRTFFQSR